MKPLQNVVAAAALLSALGAQAQVVGSLGGSTGSFVSLSSAGLAGGPIATISAGTVNSANKPSAAIPAGSVFGGAFLAAGPSSDTTATPQSSALLLAGLGAMIFVSRRLRH